MQVNRWTKRISGFFHLGAIRLVKGQLARSPIPEGTFYLLGLMFGHFDEKDDLVDDAVGGSNSINVGIGIVVPVGRILEMVSQDQIATRERQAEKVLREKRMPTMDSVEQQDELAFTKEDFETALKKVSRKPEPGK